MHELTAIDWTYEFVTPDEARRFEQDMVTYYLQLTRQAAHLPGLDDFVESPFPFFLGMMEARGELEPLLSTDNLMYRAYRDSDLYHAYREDILHYFVSGRFARRGASAKGGGFSCLVN